MRPILLGDLDAGVRFLLARAPGSRAAEARVLLRSADLADRWRKRRGRAHPRWGDGSLMAAARLAAAAAPVRSCDATYCDALATLLQAIADHRSDGQSRSGRIAPAEGRADPLSLAPAPYLR